MGRGIIKWGEELIIKCVNVINVKEKEKIIFLEGKKEFLDKNKMELLACKCGHSKKPYHEYPNIVGCGFVCRDENDQPIMCNCKKFIDYEECIKTELNQRMINEEIQEIHDTLFPLFFKLKSQFETFGKPFHYSFPEFERDIFLIIKNLIIQKENLINEKLRMVYARDKTIGDLLKKIDEYKTQIDNLSTDNIRLMRVNLEGEMK